MLNWYEAELKLNFHPSHAVWPDRGAIAWSLIWWQDGSNPNLRLWIICPSFLCLRIIRPPHIAPLITQLHFEYSISALCLSLLLLLIWIWQFRNIQVQILATIIVHIFASGPHQFELGNFQTNTNPSRIFVLACTWQWCISLMWVLLNRGGQLNAKSYHSREIQWFDPTKVTAVKPPWSLEFMKPV